MTMDYSILLDVVKSTFTITYLVMMMMLFIEFINVHSSGKLLTNLQHRPFLQIIFASLLGLIPGCIGGFTIVSLFTHRLLSFGALVAGMISTHGDEAFVIFAYSPKILLILSLILFVIGIVAGVLTDFIFKHKKLKRDDHSFEIHAGINNHVHEKAHLALKNIKETSVQRIFLIVSLVLYIIAILTGLFSHQHGGLPTIGEVHQHQHHTIFSWENILFLTLALLTLYIVSFSSEHFLQSHLWKHVIKKHLLKILLWTFSVLLLLKLSYQFFAIEAFIQNNQWTTFLLILLAVLIGIIPESGPHLIFVILFFNGSIPFSILLVSSIVQDGHGALPLLASSRSNFFLMKAVSMFVGLCVGLLGFFIGF